MGDFAAIRPVLIAAALLLLVLLPIAGKADHLDCNDLAKCCGDPRGSPDYALCVGYLVGIADAMREGTSIAGFRSCIPAEFSVPELRQVVQDSLASQHDHGPEGHHPGAALIAEAYARKWPCAE